MTTFGVSATRPAPARVSRASAVPLWLGVGALVVSVVLAIVVIFSSSATVKLLEVPLPLVVPDAWWLSFIGYLLTPVVVLACYGWDAIAQRRGQRSNVNFLQRTGYATVLRWVVIVGIVVGLWHILNLSVPLSEAWGLS